MEELRQPGRAETSCRLGWVLAILLLLYPYLVYSDGGGLFDWANVTPLPDLDIDDCHDEFTMACNNASLVYSKAFDLCELNANESIISLEVDVEMERLQIELGASAVCGNLRICEVLDDDLQYFQCISEKGNTNLDILTEITYNSTSAHTRLREDLDAVHRYFLLCSLEAQAKYMEDIRQANRELNQCRSEIDELME